MYILISCQKPTNPLHLRGVTSMAWPTPPGGIENYLNYETETESRSGGQTGGRWCGHRRRNRFQSVENGGQSCGRTVLYARYALVASNALHSHTVFVAVAAGC